MSLSIRVGNEHNISIICQSGGSWMKLRNVVEFKYAIKLCQSFNLTFSFSQQYCNVCSAMSSEHFGQITVCCLLQSLPMIFMAVCQWYFVVVTKFSYFVHRWGALRESNCCLYRHNPTHFLMSTRRCLYRDIIQPMLDFVSFSIKDSAIFATDPYRKVWCVIVTC